MRRTLDGKQHADEPHMRFAEGNVAPCTAEASLRRAHCRRQSEGRASVCAATPRRRPLPCCALTVLPLCVFSALLLCADAPKTTRYGARIYRKHRVDTPPPILRLPENWRLIEGDEGVTGCDRRLYYFTIETDGEAAPPPSVAVSWPGVEISSVGGADDVKKTADGVTFRPTGKAGGVNYITSVGDGAITLGIHHHVEGALHGRHAKVIVKNADHISPGCILVRALDIAGGKAVVSTKAEGLTPYGFPGATKNFVERFRFWWSNSYGIKGASPTLKNAVEQSRLISISRKGRKGHK